MSEKSMPITSDGNIKENNPDPMDVTLISNGEPLITSRISLICPTCSLKRTFKNTFSCDKIDLILVSLKIIDWLSCECGDLFNSQIDFEI